MKRIISTVLALVMIFSMATFSNAAVNTKLVKMNLSSVYLKETTAYGMGSFTVFEGKIVNSSKYLATIKKITVNADITTLSGHYTKSLVFYSNKKYQVNIQDGQLTSNIPMTVKGKSSSFIKVFDSQVQSLIPYTNEKFIESEFSNTKISVDMVINAITKAKTQIRKTASTKGKILKTLNAKTKVEVLALPVNGFVKVKYKSTTGYIQEKYLK